MFDLTHPNISIIIIMGDDVVKVTYKVTNINIHVHTYMYLDVIISFSWTCSDESF